MVTYAGCVHEINPSYKLYHKKCKLFFGPIILQTENCVLRIKQGDERISPTPSHQCPNKGSLLSDSQSTGVYPVVTEKSFVCYFSLSICEQKTISEDVNYKKS